MDRKLRIAATIGAALALAGTLVGPVSATYPGDVGRLAFAMNGPDGNVDIYTALQNGSTSAAADHGPRVRRLRGVLRRRPAHRVLQRPDGRVRDLGDGQERRRPARRHEHRRLRRLPRLQPRRPEDRVRRPQGSDPYDEIYVVNAANGGGLTALTSCAGYGAGCFNDYPAWSPDGRQIVFIHADDSDADGNPINEQVWVMDANGSNKTQLTFDRPATTRSRTGAPTARRSPTWTATSQRADLHDARRRESSDPAHVRAGGDFGAAWSPDGRKIAFVRNFGGGNRPVFVMNADGATSTG